MKIPRHIAIIMDGNGRWAQERGLPRVLGHKAGVESVREVVKVCRELGVEWLTLYTFSTENWRRPPEEVQTLMSMLKQLLRAEVAELHRNDVRIRGLGRVWELPPEVQEELRRAEELTKDNQGLNLVLAVSYGGRQEIVDAARRLAEDVAQGKVKPEDVNEDLFQRYTYIPEMPPPDLLIRTAGELRVSNFLLWHIAYTELYFSPKLWPDFRREELLAAIGDFSKRRRKFGGL